jgi:hypothetical protein
MVFNIADYGHTLLNDFFIAGGQFRRAEFHAPSQIAAWARGGHQLHGLRGAGAVEGRDAGAGARPDRAADPAARGALRAVYRHVLTVPRRDGLVVQSFAGGEMQGYGDTSEAPDRAEAEQAVRTSGQAVLDGRLIFRACASVA